MRKKGAVFLLAGLAACGGAPASADFGGVPVTACSELARAIYSWRGEEATVCGPETAEQQHELLALGDGYVLDWAPATGIHRLWSVGTGSTPLGPGPLMTGISPFGVGHVLHPLSGRRVLDNELLSTGVHLYSVDENMQGNDGGTAIEPRISDDAWSDPFWGYDLVALDDDYVLRWWSGTGEYVVLNSKDKKLVNTDFHGTQEALRRGAKIVNLGQHRLLEWIPLTGAYRIWSYHLDGDGPEIFDPAPVFPPATLTGVGRRDELLVVDQTPGAEKIVVWRRDDGSITMRSLDPLAADPLGGDELGEGPYPVLASPDWDAPTTSRIENVVLVLQQGRSFDSYFGQYCQGAGMPTCEEGPACCGAMPGTTPGAAAVTAIDPAVDDHIPNTTTACLTAKIDNGAMDGFATAPGCGSPLDFACAGVGQAAGAVADYQRLADGGALADHFFQTTTLGDGISAVLNVIYLSKAAFGMSLSTEGGDDQLSVLLSNAGVRYALYLGNPRDPAQRGDQLPPKFYDPHWTAFRSIDELDRDISLQQLAAISVVIPPDGLDEQPGTGPAAKGIARVTELVNEIAASARYQPTTLVLLGYLTAGGYYDHVAPPAPSSVDSMGNGTPIAYGPRVPLLATGQFARPGHVSHVPMEMSSLTAFMEWNWTGGVVGQLGHRDAVVANIGSLIDPDQAGAPVPELPPAP